MNLESIVQRGVSQKEKNKHYILKNYVESIKMVQMNLFPEQE